MVPLHLLALLILNQTETPQRVMGVDTITNAPVKFGDGTNNAVRVNIVAGGIDGGTVTVLQGGTWTTQDADAGATLAQVSLQLALISSQLGTIASRLQPALNGSLRTTSVSTALPPNAAQETSGNLAATAASLAVLQGNQVNGSQQTQVVGSPAVSVDGGVQVLNFPQSTVVSNLPKTLSGAVRTDSSATQQPVLDSQSLVQLVQAVALQTNILANQTNGAQTTVVASHPPVIIQLNQRPLNPFLSRCNAVRTTQCQP
jgi:hypothetical protein